MRSRQVDRMLAVYLTLGLAGFAVSNAASAQPSPESAATGTPLANSSPAQAAQSVGKHKTLELVFTADTVPSNPFDTYLLRLEVTDPAGTKITMDGFYDGDGQGGQTGKVWKARLCPDRTGRWSWRTAPGDAPDTALAGLSGQFDCVESRDRGGLVAEGRYFRLQDGDYFFPVGNFLDEPGGLPLWSFLGEETTDAQRDAIIARQRDFHMANKYMFYLSNHSDSEAFREYVTPWVGSRAESDKTRMDLARWKLYDGYLRRMKDSGLLAHMSIFEDGKKGSYGLLPPTDKHRLCRYAMARTSAFSHLFYVICLEWQEAWSKDQINETGRYLAAHNPWKRLLSVHDWGQEPWAFGAEKWPTFIAAQSGNYETPAKINSYSISIRRHSIPQLADEFGFNKTDSDARIWASFCGGAAGVGTGTELKAFQRFLVTSQMPFQRMVPSNDLVEGGGSNRFCLAESGHHYVVYSQSGSFALTARGTGLSGRWFNPRDVSGSLGASFSVSSGVSAFTTPPPTTADWVLWITDGTNLASGTNHPSMGADIVRVVVSPPPAAR